MRWPTVAAVKICAWQNIHPTSVGTGEPHGRYAKVTLASHQHRTPPMTRWANSTVI